MKEKFLAELKDLLTRYKAELSADDHYQGWAEVGQDIRMTVTFPSQEGLVEIDLGGYITGN